jgi:hypothetical protein
LFIFFRIRLYHDNNIEKGGREDGEERKREGRGEGGKE